MSARRMLQRSFHRCRIVSGAIGLALACSIAFGAALAEEAAVQLTSPAFAQQGEIPQRDTCEGEDVAPALAWSAPPAGTRSLALIVSDPDAPDPAAPKRTWVHWVLYDIPPAARGLPEGAKPLPGAAREGLNDWTRTGYSGPCPPVGRHRYVFDLYALDTGLSDLERPDKAHLEAAMQGHVLAHAQLVGTYQKQR